MTFKRRIFSIILLAAVFLSSCAGDIESITEDANRIEGDAESESIAEINFETEQVTDTVAPSLDEEIPPSYYLYTDDEMNTFVYGETVYAVYSNHAELISSDAKIRELVVRDEINGVPVTSISEEILDNISDPNNFRIFASSDSFAREFAVTHDCIFIELYDGNFPDHFYPYGNDPSVWVLNDDPSDPKYKKDHSKVIAQDRSVELDLLVKRYLSGGDGYEEIYEILLQYFAAAQCFQESFLDHLPDLYLREYCSSCVDDYDKYYVYEISDGNIIPYRLVRYDEFETFDEITSYADILYTSNVVNANTNNITLKNAGGYLADCSGGMEYSYMLADMDVEMKIEKNAILWRTNYSIVEYNSMTEEFDFIKKTPYYNSFLVRENGQWGWDNFVFEWGWSNYVSR